MIERNTMRVTGGTLVRKRFFVPPLADLGLVRPTPDRVRESVFAMLNDSFANAHVLDLFSGSGSHAFEAISRGALQVTLVENHPETAKCLRENVEKLGVSESCRIVLGDAVRFVSSPASHKMNVVFVDPPYSVVLAQSFWEGLSQWVDEKSLVVFRCFKKQMPNIDGLFLVRREKVYGGTRVFILEKAPLTERLEEKHNVSHEHSHISGQF